MEGRQSVADRRHDFPLHLPCYSTDHVAQILILVSAALSVSRSNRHGVEAAAAPLIYIVPMPLMLQIRDRGEEIGVAGSAADVFRRAGVLAGEALDAEPRLRLNTGALDQDRVMPVIAEVVDVIEAARLATQGGTQHDAALVHLLQFVVPFGVGLGVAQAA